MKIENFVFFLQISSIELHVTSRRVLSFEEGDSFIIFLLIDASYAYKGYRL